MSKGGGSQPLKEANRPKLRVVISANAALLYAFSQYQAVSTSGLGGLLAGSLNLVPLTLAVVLTTVANGVLKDATKNRLVFMRRHHVMPGHRAFSELALADPRIDVDGLSKLLGKEWPNDPEAENRAWFRLYKEIENDPAVFFVHGEYLFTRDYAAMAALFVVGLGAAAALVVRPLPVLLVYLVGLLAQFWVVRHVAANYGERFVCTVLARTVARPLKQPSPPGRRAPKAAKTP